MFVPDEVVVIARKDAAVAVEVVEFFVQDFVNQGAFARAGCAGDAGENAERDFHINVIEIVRTRALDEQSLAVLFPALGRNRDLPLAAEVLRGRRFRACYDLREGAACDHMPAVNAGARPHLDDVIRSADGVFVVFDHNDRIANVAQSPHGVDHLDIVFGVQANAGFVEHIEHAHQPRADLRGKANALRFAPRKRARRPVEIEIIQANAHEEFQARRDFNDDLRRDFPMFGRQAELREKREQFRQVHLAQAVDVVILDCHQQALFFEPLAPAVRARVFDHDFSQIVFHAPVRHAFLPVPAIQAFDLIDHAVVAKLAPGVFRPNFRARRVFDNDFFAFCAVQEQVFNLVGEVFVRRVKVKLVFF